jgi:hypothetical protein
MRWEWVYCVMIGLCAIAAAGLVLWRYIHREHPKAIVCTAVPTQPPPDTPRSACEAPQAAGIVYKNTDDP